MVLKVLGTLRVPSASSKTHNESLSVIFLKLTAMVRSRYRTIAVNLVENTASHCSAGSPCPAHYLNVAGLGGARRPGGIMANTKRVFV